MRKELSPFDGLELLIRKPVKSLFRLLDEPFEEFAKSAVDVYEEGNDVVIKADLPGFKKEEIRIQLEDNTLSLEAKREKDEEVSERNYYRKERREVYVREAITLPAEVDRDKAAAKLENGVLIIRLPKTGPTRSGTTINIE
ncbi:archaeal heat shock protein Hsp14 [Candidatus Desulforudis audaxviator]|nr:archaeal heat shock protein Hsp14 [Candidatus Desulforudis audaxviator]AZK59623.1 Small heat shock protein Hsp20 [Candidatus Desulforudis audaxviator]